MAELKSTKRRLHLADGAVSCMPERLQSQLPQLREEEVTLVAAETARAAAEFNV